MRLLVNLMLVNFINGVFLRRRYYYHFKVIFYLVRFFLFVFCSYVLGANFTEVFGPCLTDLIISVSASTPGDPPEIPSDSEGRDSSRLGGERLFHSHTSTLNSQNARKYPLKGSKGSVNNFPGLLKVTNTDSGVGEGRSIGDPVAGSSPINRSVPRTLDLGEINPNANSLVVPVGRVVEKSGDVFINPGQGSSAGSSSLEVPRGRGPDNRGWPLPDQRSLRGYPHNGSGDRVYEGNSAAKGQSFESNKTSKF